MTPSTRSVVILIVEADVKARDALSAILSDQGYRAVAAADEHTAVELVHARRPDLVLLDVLPSRWMLGEAFAAGLWLAYRGLISLVVTSTDPSIVARAGRLAGVRMALARPHDPSRLADAIRAALAASDKAPMFAPVSMAACYFGTVHVNAVRPHPGG